jgi:hypothetical protein
MHVKTFRRAFIPRREFNPSNVKDLHELKFFKEHNKWKEGCPFYLEDPFVDIPTMCESKYTSYMLTKLK